MPESVDRDRTVVATYYVEDVRGEDEFIDHLRQVERLALEGSTSSWMDVAEETDELRERLSSKGAGDFGNAAPRGTKRADGGRGKARLRRGWTWPRRPTNCASG